MRRNRPDILRHATLDPAQGAVVGALAALADFIAAAGCDADLELRLAVIVEELIANIVEHGRMPVDDCIGLTLILQGSDVRIALSDTGIFHDPRNMEDMSDLPPDRGGGAGIRLVMAWSTLLTYQHVDGRNELVLAVEAGGFE